MKIRNVALYQLELPLAQPFSHSAKCRTVTETIIVRVESDQGVINDGAVYSLISRIGEED